MLIREYRVPLPLTMDEFERGMLWSVARKTWEETANGEGTEVLVNERFTNKPILPHIDPTLYTSGIFTKKVHYLDGRIPWYIPKKRLFPPDGVARVREKCYNSFPYYKTEVRLPGTGFTQFDFKMSLSVNYRLTNLIFAWQIGLAP